MALWSNTDANTSAPKNAVAAGLGVSANGYTLFDNTTTDAYVPGIALGVFGVSNDEQQVVNQSIHGAHAGWNLVKQGTGGRAGRVQVETLVAMGSMYGDGTTADDVVLRLPESFADGTTSVTWVPRKAFIRTETFSTGSTLINLQYSAGIGTFTSTNLIGGAGLSVGGAGIAESCSQCGAGSAGTRTYRTAHPRGPHP